MENHQNQKTSKLGLVARCLLGAGIAIVGIGLAAICGGCEDPQGNMALAALGNMSQVSPYASANDRTLGAGLGTIGQMGHQMNTAQAGGNQIYVSSGGSIQPIYYGDGTVYIPALTGSTVTYHQSAHRSDGMVTGTLKVKDGHSLFWGDQSGLDTTMNLGFHVADEVVLRKDNLHSFSLNGIRLDTLLNEQSTAQNPQTGSSKFGFVNITAEDSTFEVLVDGAFVGNSPAKLKLSEGPHTIEVKKDGFKDYKKEIRVTDGSELNLRAVLEKQ